MKDKTGKELSSGEVSEKIVNRMTNVLLEFEIFLLHIVGCIPLHHVRRFFYRLAGMHIGSDSTLHMGTRFYDPRNIIIGNDTIIGEGAVLDGRGKLTIGNHVDVATEVMIYNCEHDVQCADFAANCASVTIEDYAFIGPRAIILPGVTIKKGAVVGAGAVVTNDVEECIIVGGVPAKQIGERKVKEFTYRLGRARWFR